MINNHTNNSKKQRVMYLIATTLLFTTEILIALFVHDAFIRPYLGDVLVVILVYTFIRIFIPEKCKLLPLWVFLFAAAVEGLQALHLVVRLGLEDSVFFRTVLGSYFDWKDILCYAIGCILLAGYEIMRVKRAQNSGVNQ